MGSLTGTLYTGITGNLLKRVFQHKFHRIEGFTDQYDVERLLYCELFDDAHQAIAREKQLKGWRRSKKVALIESVNPHWLNLAREWYPWMKNFEGRGASTPQGAPQADRPAPLSMTNNKDSESKLESIPRNTCHAERQRNPLTLSC